MAAVQSDSMAQAVDAHGSTAPDPSAPSQPVAKSAPEPTIPYSWREWHPNAQFIYIRDHRQANQALTLLNPGPYGFDLEWRPNFRKGQAENPVAVVQLANHEIILVLQISAMREFPLGLGQFLLNPHFTKVGVGIQGDAKKFHHDWRCDIKNCVDLALLARSVDNDRWKGRYTDPLGLARLTSAYKERVLAKGKITRSNWEGVLTEAQQTYAANDAHSGYIIYTTLMEMLPSVSPQPEAKYFTFDTSGGQPCLPFERTAWKPHNPNYNPGPLPPPKEPKRSKPPRQAGNSESTTKPSSPTQALVPSGSGSGSPLPAPQSIPKPRDFYSHRGNLGSHSNSTPQRRSRGRSFQFTSHFTSRQPHFSNDNSTRHPNPSINNPQQMLSQQQLASQNHEVLIIPVPSMNTRAPYYPNQPNTQNT